jgi:hypothetical protein
MQKKFSKVDFCPICANFLTCSGKSDDEGCDCDLKDVRRIGW